MEERWYKKTINFFLAALLILSFGLTIVGFFYFMNWFSEIADSF
jgi:hypothetical protein